MSVYIIDLVILAVLAVFAWRGAKKGLILSLFSLLALFVAFFGAKYVSSHFSGPVADILRPSIQLSINDLLTGEDSSPMESTGSNDPTPSAGTEDPDTTEDGSSPQPDTSLPHILGLLEQAGLFPGLQEYLSDAIDAKILDVTTSAAAAVASYLARLAATAVLFGLSFVAILLVWGLAGRALDLTFKLPILSIVNALGGLLFGLLKAVFIVMVLVWLGRLIGWIDGENAGPVTEMMSPARLSQLLKPLIALGAAAN